LALRRPLCQGGRALQRVRVRAQGLAHSPGGAVLAVRTAAGATQIPRGEDGAGGRRDRLRSVRALRGVFPCKPGPAWPVTCRDRVCAAENQTRFAVVLGPRAVTRLAPGPSSRRRPCSPRLPRRGRPSAPAWSRTQAPRPAAAARSRRHRNRRDSDDDVASRGPASLWHWTRQRLSTRT